MDLDRSGTASFFEFLRFFYPRVPRLGVTRMCQTTVTAKVHPPPLTRPHTPNMTPPTTDPPPAPITKVPSPLSLATLLPSGPSGPPTRAPPQELVLLRQQFRRLSTNGGQELDPARLDGRLLIFQGPPSPLIRRRR